MLESIKNCSTAQKNKKDIMCTYIPLATEPQNSWEQERYIATKFSKVSCTKGNLRKTEIR